jgi:hypothetical protein
MKDFHGTKGWSWEGSKWEDFGVVAGAETSPTCSLEEWEGIGWAYV